MTDLALAVAGDPLAEVFPSALTGHESGMRVLCWHVHGAWTTAFVQGRHDYLVPVVPGRGPDGLGRATTYEWPDSVTEVTPAELAEAEVDVVVLQRPRDAELCRSWLRRLPGIDLPAVWLEHNAPQGRIAEMRHPAADLPGVPVIHVTHFNDLFWDCGDAPTTVIEHGIVDPGYRYTGELDRLGVAINEPVRRGRVTGTDLLPAFAAVAPLDVFGMGVDALSVAGVTTYDDLPQARLHEQLARRRAYLHPVRWTSLGLALLEAMHLGMPVLALATTEAVEAVPPETGVLSTRVDRLVEAARDLVHDPEQARLMGKAARAAALERYGLARFLADWDRLLVSLP